MTESFSSPDAPQRRGSRRLWALVLILASAGLFSNTLSFGAAWDDQRFVFNSGATDGVSAIPGMFTTQMVRDVPRARGAYRPLTASSYALDWSVGGGDARFFHWTNVALHVLVTLLVFALLMRLRAPVGAAGLGGLVYAVHPVHVEAVANIAGRAELLVGLFMVAAAVVYLGGRGLLRNAAILGCFVGALLSKEHGITLPVLLVVLEVLRPGAEGRPLSRLLDRTGLWIGMAVTGAGYMLVRRTVLGTFSTSDVAPFIGDLSTGRRVTTAIANWFEYARLHLFPLDLSVDYGPAVIMPSGPADLLFWAGLAVGGGLVTVAWLAWPRHRLATLGAAWFAVTMLPSSNLLVPIAQWLAERFFYVPSVGFAMLVAAAWAARPASLGIRETRLITTAVVLVVIGFSVRSWNRNARWEDSTTVIATLITEHPEAFRAQWYLGRLYFDQGRLDEAFAALDSATALQPNAFEMRLERAEWLIRLARFPEAVELLESLPHGRHVDREAHLVRALRGVGQTQAADSALGRGLEVFPQSPRLVQLSDSLGALTEGR